MIKNLTNTNAQVFIQMTEEQLEAFATNIIEKCMALKTDEKESYLTIDEVVKMLDVTPISCCTTSCKPHPYKLSLLLLLHKLKLSN